ncbi:NACHT C-terminal alpha/beta 1 domain-containing protein [Limnospira platensis]|uniref:NACHT C-terminal alpha/beta 1 domain-containing protein n=1 Tax=Limnospira platensis TaxID=118562 RepID=UPI003D6DDDA5
MKFIKTTLSNLMNATNSSGTVPKTSPIPIFIKPGIIPPPPPIPKSPNKPPITAKQPSPPSTSPKPYNTSPSSSSTPNPSPTKPGKGKSRQLLPHRALLLTDCEHPTPELISFCAKLTGVIAIAILTEDPLDAPLKGFPPNKRESDIRHCNLVSRTLTKCCGIPLPRLQGGDE